MALKKILAVKRPVATWHRARVLRSFVTKLVSPRCLSVDEVTNAPRHVSPQVFGTRKSLVKVRMRRELIEDLAYLGRAADITSVNLHTLFRATDPPSNRSQLYWHIRTGRRVAERSRGRTGRIVASRRPAIAVSILRRVHVFRANVASSTRC